MIFNEFTNKNQMIWMLQAKVIAKTKSAFDKMLKNPSRVLFIRIKNFGQNFQIGGEHKNFMVDRAPHEMNNGI